MLGGSGEHTCTFSGPPNLLTPGPACHAPSLWESLWQSGPLVTGYGCYGAWRFSSHLGGYRSSGIRQTWAQIHISSGPSSPPAAGKGSCKRLGSGAEGGEKSGLRMAEVAMVGRRGSVRIRGGGGPRSELPRGLESGPPVPRVQQGMLARSLCQALPLWFSCFRVSLCSALILDL